MFLYLDIIQKESVLSQIFPEFRENLVGSRDRIYLWMWQGITNLGHCHLKILAVFDQNIVHPLQYHAVSEKGWSINYPGTDPWVPRRQGHISDLTQTIWLSGWTHFQQTPGHRESRRAVRPQRGPPSRPGKQAEFTTRDNSVMECVFSVLGRKLVQSQEDVVCRYRDSHYKDKTSVIIFVMKLHTWKDRFYIETGPGRVITNINICKHKSVHIWNRMGCFFSTKQCDGASQEGNFVQ